MKNKEKQLKKQTKYKQRRSPRNNVDNREKIQQFEKQMFASQKSTKNDSRTFTKNTTPKRTKKYTNYEKENKQKGDNYELFLVNHFRALGYIVVEHGLLHGQKDRGIDIILRKDNENLFIQAKNWKEDGRKIDHSMIKAFIGDVAFYIEDNPVFGLANIKRYYITSNDVLDGSAKNFIKEHNEKIEHFIIPMP
jgi:hypothetical protein